MALSANWLWQRRDQREDIDVRVQKTRLDQAQLCTHA